MVGKVGDNVGENVVGNVGDRVGAKVVGCNVVGVVGNLVG